MARRKKLRIKKKALRSLILIVLIILVISAVVILKENKISIAVFNRLKEDNITITYDNEVKNEKKEYSVSISYLGDEELECSLNDQDYVNIKECKFDLLEGKYTIHLRKDNNKISKEFTVKGKYDGEFKSTIDVLDTYYLALGGTKTMEYTFDYPEGYDTERTYNIEDGNIISVEGDTIKGLANGTTTLNVRLKDGNSKNYKIMVTDIISPPTLNNRKEYLPCMRYTQEEADLLDKILDSRVQEAGEGTRGGVVAAARFINLEFKYQIKYFNENGRLNDHGIRPHIDGEGRFFHKGMYLQTDKYNVLEPGASDTGPKPWGCEIYDRFISRMNKNGLDCSGFVTWAMYQGGFIYHDSGAGEFAEFDDDLSDLGPHHEITDNYMKTGNYQVGDFIARNGHAALIIGITDDTVYTAESLPPRLEIYIYGRYTDIPGHKSLVHDDNLTYVVEMGDIYPNGDGWYHVMW